MSYQELQLAELTKAYPLPEEIEDAVLNRSQIALALQVSENTITRWISQGMPVEEEGSNGREYQFQLSHCYAWRVERDAQQREARKKADAVAAQMSLLFRNNDAEDPNEGLLSAEDVIKESQADVARNKAAELRRELVRAHRMRSTMEEVMMAFRNHAITIVDFAEMEFGLEPEGVEKFQLRTHGIKGNEGYGPSKNQEDNTEKIEEEGKETNPATAEESTNKARETTKTLGTFIGTTDFP